MTTIVETVPDIGDRWRLGNHVAAYTAAEIAADAAHGAFKTGGTATDPTAVTLTLEAPDGTQTVWAWPTPGGGQSQLEKEATGRFYADHTWDQDGLHWCRLAGTGAVVAAVEFGVVVQARRVE